MWDGQERRSELSQAIRMTVAKALEQHEVDEKRWLEKHEKKDADLHRKVCAKLEAISAEQQNIKGLIQDVKNVWDGMGAIGKGVMFMAKVIASIGVIWGALWAMFHFGNPSR